MGFVRDGNLYLPESIALAEGEAPPPELRELATTRDGRDITRGYSDRLEILTPQDTVLQLRCHGDYQLYEEILRDDQVHATLDQRRLAVVSRELEVEAASEDAIDQKAADHLREVLAAIKWDAVTAKMAYGVFYGFAVGECLWARDGGTITLEAIKVRKQRRFRWSPAGELKLLTIAAPQGEVLPDRKFWTFSTGADNDDEPYGLGLAHWLYWPVFFKRQGLKFWAIFLEKFAAGTAVGKYSRGATKEERKKLLEALRAIQIDSGVVLPEGMAIELLQVARSGTADYTELLSRMDAAISKVVLGQTMTTDDGSSLAQGQVHLSVRDELVKADSDLICESFNQGPVRWLTEWNYPGAKPPRVWRRPPSAKSQELFQYHLEFGVASTNEIRARLGLPPIDDGDEPPQRVAPAPGADLGAAFAEGRPAATTDKLSDQLGKLSGAVLAGLVEDVRRIVAEAGSLEEVRDRLLEAYSGLDPALLGQLIQRAMVAGELAGRAEVKNGR